MKIMHCTSITPMCVLLKQFLLSLSHMLQSVPQPTIYMAC